MKRESSVRKALNHSIQDSVLTTFMHDATWGQPRHIFLGITGDVDVDVDVGRRLPSH